MVFGIRFLLIAALFCGGVATPQSHMAAMHGATEADALRAIAKYKAVFSLIPHRVSQVLRVVGAYPKNNTNNRHDLVSKTVAFLQDKYRAVQLLYSIVAVDYAYYRSVMKGGIESEYSSLMNAIKKYQTTLISSMSVLDGEAAYPQSAPLGTLRSKNYNDATAYQSALAVLKHNAVDSVVDVLAEHNNVPHTSDALSVREELTQLKSRVATLMDRVSHNQGSGDEPAPVVEDDVRSLSGPNTQASRSTLRSNRLVEYAKNKMGAVSTKTEKLRATLSEWHVKVRTLAVTFFENAKKGLLSYYRWAEDTVNTLWARYVTGSQKNDVPSKRNDKEVVLEKDLQTRLKDQAVAAHESIKAFVTGAVAHIQKRSFEALDGATYATTMARDTAVSGVTTLYDSWADLLNKGYALIEKTTASLCKDEAECVEKSKKAQKDADKDTVTVLAKTKALFGQADAYVRLLALRIKAEAVAAYYAAHAAVFAKDADAVEQSEEKAEEAEGRIEKIKASLTSVGTRFTEQAKAVTSAAHATVAGWWDRLTDTIAAVRSSEAVAA
jgi:hypothetical protein